MLECLLSNHVARVTLLLFIKTLVDFNKLTWYVNVKHDEQTSYQNRYLCLNIQKNIPMN